MCSCKMCFSYYVINKLKSAVLNTVYSCMYELQRKASRLDTVNVNIGNIDCSINVLLMSIRELHDHIPHGSAPV